MTLQTASSHPLRRLLAALAAVLIALGLSSCSEEVPVADPIDADGIVIITNSHANVPTPQLPKKATEMVGSALQHGLPIILVSADGTPEWLDLGSLKVEGNNPDAYRSSLNRALSLIGSAITALPNADGANSYDAFAVAVGQAQSEGMSRPIFVCIACGLDTSGPLDMTLPGALQSDVEALVEHLSRENQLVSFSAFTHAEVHLVATGATALPQEPLSPRLKKMLTEQWEGVLKAGGAEVHLDHIQLSGAPIETEFTVPTIALDPEPVRTVIPACAPPPDSFDGASGARFEPDQAEWVDVDEARGELSRTAEWLKADPARSIVISGTTSDDRTGDPSEGKILSLARARKAADLLISLGVNPSQITDVRGLGPNYPGRVEDREPDGTPIPHLRTMNRKIIVDYTAPC